MTIPASQTASLETISLNEPHPPAENAIEAFEVAEATIKSEILKSRNHWDLHEPKMWSRAQGVSDKDLVAFTIRDDLVEVRSAATSYGAIILGKIRLPAINDEEGEGYVHVRCVYHCPTIRVIPSGPNTEGTDAGSMIPLTGYVAIERPTQI